MSIGLVHSNPVAIAGGVLKVDRKFHSGMLRYAAGIRQPLVSINAAARAGQAIMDPIEVPLERVPYEVVTIRTDAAGVALPSEIARLRAQLARQTLVYGGDMGVADICRTLRVPCVLIVEHDLTTKIAVTALEARGRLRRLVRSARCTWRHLAADIPRMRAAQSVHCNGFPAYDNARRYNANCLLYLDSRMSRQMLLAPDQLRERLSQQQHRPLRLLYSGRYEALKGALDVLRVAQGCLERDLAIELHCYGQGTLRASMQRLAARWPGRLHVHDAIAYPELVQVSRSFDLFVCCHVQNDPSCTYLEAMGAGLPIVGYANGMWRELCRSSRAGLCSPLGSPGGVAESIATLCRDRALLADLSQRALAFARTHCFEAEFDRRTEAINALASQSH
jgi:glycosyltransferase involved in cell wall biosynthesis